MPTWLRFGTEHDAKICEIPSKACFKRPHKNAPVLESICYRFRGPLGPQLGSNLDPKMAPELPKSRPRGAYESPKKPLEAKNRPKAAQDLPKPPHGGAYTP